MIQNLSIDDSGVTNDHIMFGENIYGAVKTFKQNPDRGVMEYVSVPRKFLRLNKFITLMEDVMFVNVIPFLVTI